MGVTAQDLVNGNGSIFGHCNCKIVIVLLLVIFGAKNSKSWLCIRKLATLPLHWNSPGLQTDLNLRSDHNAKPI